MFVDRALSGMGCPGSRPQVRAQLVAGASALCESRLESGLVLAGERDQEVGSVTEGVGAVPIYALPRTLATS